MAENCRGCKYWRPLGDSGGLHACHFMLDTGVPRNCPAEKCVYNTKGTNNMSRGLKIPSGIIGQIELMINEGKSIQQISKALNVGKSTVYRVRNGMKEKSPETAAAVPENNQKECAKPDTSIIADTGENVKQVIACGHDEIPGIVRATIAREIDNLTNELEILAERIEKVKADKAELEKWYFGTAPHIRYREEHTGNGSADCSN